MNTVQQPTFDYFQVFVLGLVVLLFYIGTKANDVIAKPRKLRFFEGICFFAAAFLFIALPFCKLVYEAFLSSMDLYVWMGAIVPPVTAGFTARTQMEKLVN